MKKFLLSGIMACGMTMYGMAYAGCPAPDTVLSKFMANVLKNQQSQQSAEIISKKYDFLKTREIAPGICGTLVRKKGGRMVRPFIFTQDGKYAAIDIMNLKTGQSWKQEVVGDLEKMTEADMNEMRRMSIHIGDKGPSVILVLDPDCPFCKKEVQELADLVKNGKLQIDLFFLPLPMHQGADDKAAALTCAMKTGNRIELFAGIADGKIPDIEQKCIDEQKRAINEHITFAVTKELVSTPTTILNDGSVISGYVQADSFVEIAK